MEVRNEELRFNFVQWHLGETAVSAYIYNPYNSEYRNIRGSYLENTDIKQLKQYIFLLLTVEKSREQNGIYQWVI